MIAGTEVDLCNQRLVMATLEAERIRRGLSTTRVLKGCSVASNTFYSWRTNSRVATVWKLVTLASFLGFEIVLQRRDGDPVEVDVSDQSKVMAALEAERRRLGLRLVDLEDKSGVSANAYIAYRDGTRKARLCNLVAFAETLHFTIVMRRRTA